MSVGVNSVWIKGAGTAYRAGLMQCAISSVFAWEAVCQDIYTMFRTQGALWLQVHNVFVLLLVST